MLSLNWALKVSIEGHTGAGEPFQDRTGLRRLHGGQGNLEGCRSDLVERIGGCGLAGNPLQRPRGTYSANVTAHGHFL
jgi:hypothetical protein